MPDLNTPPLSQVFCDVLENVGFMFGDPVEKSDLPAEQANCMRAIISYRGPMSGTLTLLAARAIADELIENVLGLDPDDEEAEQAAADAIGELMNVTLGQLLTTVAGEEPVFDLSPPSVDRQIDPAEWAQMIQDAETRGVLVDDAPVLLKFTTNAAA